MLDGTYDYEADREKMRQAFIWKAKCARNGGPLPKKVLDAMPPYEEYVQHLRAKFKMELKNLSLKDPVTDLSPVKRIAGFDQFRRQRTKKRSTISVFSASKSISKETEQRGPVGR